MKLPTDKINKSELYMQAAIKCNECCDLKAKFSIRNINLLFGALYMIIFITSYYTINYVHYVIEQKSFEFQTNCERIINKEIIRNRIMISKNNNQNGHYETKLPSDFYNRNNNQQQNVQNERKNMKIHDTIAHNNYLNDHSKNLYPQKRLKRDADNLFKDNDLFSNYDNNDNQNDEPVVEAEFFDPKYRGELELRDAEMVRKTGKSSANGDEWVWLTQYCRIPYEAITGYCKEAKNYCPPGLQGPPGREGKTGTRGPKGEIGFPGNPGLDGRDGINGEPGLDGIPGRAGADGVDGFPGKDGKDGIPGLDGKNGAQGPPGLPGPQGMRGMKGEKGSRGRTGKPGKDGVPGINTWKVKVNGTYSDELLVPPSIATAEYNTNKPRSIVVREGEHLRLRCAANGYPPPNVEWVRQDERAISFGAWELSSVSGHTLNITKVNRVHMGLYKCIADNGIPPTANQTYQLEVYFAPLIQIRSQTIYVENDSTATLECEVEAFPDPFRFWEKLPENKLLEQNDGKYFIETVHTDRYKSIMRLNITKIRSHDYGEYRCVSKNEMGIARAVFQVQERYSYMITSASDDTPPIMFGARPPLKESFEDLCPPQICPDCTDVKETKCRDTSVSLNDLFGGNLELKPSGNKTYMGLPSRTLECVLYAVGKPVYIKYTEQNYGSWLKDSAAKNDVQGEKIWSTRENDDFQLFEYANKVEAYRNNVPSKVYRLQFPFKGNAHVVYNGYFYYFRRDEPKIVKYDLTMDKQAGMKELDFATTNNTNYLYTTEYNLVDFNVDENGLWVIYSTADSNNTIVSMLNPITLEALYSLNISINHHKVGEMFITCGVLYAIDSATDKNTKIRFALDLYTLKLLDVPLSFTNPFKKTTTLGYNHKNKELYALDKGNQLLYPIRYHEMNHTTSRNDESVNTQQQANYDMNSYNRGNLN